ncbi:MAG: nucleotidyltransferase domain-containing protein [Candidatus Humimicrobiaceae bacterium]
MVTKTNKNLIYDKIEKYINTLIKNDISLKELYLFGSYTGSNCGPDSDIDVAVVIDNYNNDIVEILSLLLRLRRNIDLRIEPHPFTKDEFKRDKPHQGIGCCRYF